MTVVATVSARRQKARKLELAFVMLISEDQTAKVMNYQPLLLSNSYRLISFQSSSFTLGYCYINTRSLCLLNIKGIPIKGTFDTFDTRFCNLRNKRLPELLIVNEKLTVHCFDGHPTVQNPVSSIDHASYIF